MNASASLSDRESRSALPHDGRRPRRKIRAGGALSLTVLIYLGIVAATHTLNVADAALYAGDISNWAGGVRNGTMWEFSHVAWRPLGYLLSRLAWPALSAATEAHRALFIRGVLDDVSLFSGGVSAVLFWLLARDESRSDWIACGLASGFLCFEAFLSFAPAGTSYIPGMMFSTLGLWLATRAVEATRSRAWMAGAASGVAALFWIPYVLSIPATLLTGWLWLPRDRRKIFLLWAFLGATVIGLAGYAIGAEGRGIHTVHQFRGWMQTGVHAKQTKNLLREGMGFPRAFMDMGGDGVLYKRFLLHDPYTPVRPADLALASLWKIALFYVFLASLAFCLWRRKALQILAAAAIPHLMLGILYEAGSLERYLPIFPFLLLATSIGLAAGETPRWARLTIVGFLVVSGLTNLWASTRMPQQLHSKEKTAVRTMNSLLPPESTVWILDKDLQQYLICWPFDFANEPTHVQVRQLYIPMDVGLPWKQGFSAETIAAWARGRTVWLTKGLFANRPLPEYSWVERDQPDEVWEDFPAFVRRFDYSAAVGGDEGFVRLADDDRNRALLTEFAAR